MSSSLDPELSSAELRSKLFHTFKSKGVVQSVKTQLRKQLALDLQDKAAKQRTSGSNHAGGSEDRLLFQRICNSLIIDHLKHCLYDYTLSVFISESSTNHDQTIPLPDILDILQIQRNSRLFEALSSACTYNTDSKGFLWTFLSTIAKNPQTPLFKRDGWSQTEEAHDVFRLDRKLLEIEKNEFNKVQSSLRGDYECVQEKLLSFQRQYEKKKQEELASQMERYKSTELANMRMEEREKCQKEFLGMKTEYESMYRTKLQHVEREEAVLREKTLQREKELERDGYEQRQRVIEELNNVKQREMEQKQEHQSAMMCVAGEEKRLEAKEEELKAKEKSIQEMEDYYENKIKQEKLRLKVEFQEKELEKGRAMDTREQQLKDQILNFESQKQVYLQWKDEAERLGKDNEQQKLFIEKSKQTHEFLNEKFKIVSQRCENMADYGDIKSKNIALEKDLEVCRASFADLTQRTTEHKEEQQKLVKGLIAKLNETAFEQENKVRLLEEQERGVTLKLQVLQTKHAILQKKFTVQLKKNEELQKLYEDTLLSQRQLLQECDDLKLEVQFGQHGTQNPPPPPSKPKLLLSNTIEDVLAGEKTGAVRDSKKKVRLVIPLTPEEDTGTAVDIEESNQVLSRLEAEAVQLENSYKQFQDRQRQIKSNLPQYVPTGKSHAGMSEREKGHSSDLHKMDLVSAAQTLLSMQPDSFDISHLIPSRRVTNSSTTRRTIPPHSTPVASEEDTKVTQTTPSSFHMTELNQPSIADSIAPSNANIVLNTDIAAGLLAADVDLSASGRASLVETIEAIQSLTQIPLTESVRPVNTQSENAITPETTQVPLLASLTQVPLTETICKIEQQATVKASETPIGSLPLNDSGTTTRTASQHPVSSLTQIPLSQTIAQIDEHKNDPSARLVLESSTNESGKHRTEENLEVPSASALRKTLTHIETFNPTNTGTLDINELLSPVDPFTTSDFVLKGLQSTIVSRKENELDGGPVSSSQCLPNDAPILKEKSLIDDPLKLGEERSDVFELLNQASKEESEKLDQGSELSGLVLHQQDDDDVFITSKPSKTDESSKLKSLNDGIVHVGDRKSLDEVDEIVGDKVLSVGEEISEGVPDVVEEVVEEVPEESPEKVADDNPMNQYMQMILEKKKKEDEADVGDDIFEKPVGVNQVGTKEKDASLVGDISLSQSEGQQENSEASSDFEW